MMATFILIGVAVAAWAVKCCCEAVLASADVEE